MASASESNGVISVGDPAPAFTLAAVNRDGDISLADYEGRQSLLLGLFRGLHCPFCRRQVAQMNRYVEQLAALEVAPLAVINTELVRAKAYYGRLGFDIALAVDPNWETHRRYGLTRAKMTFGKTQWPQRVNPMDIFRVQVEPSDEFPEAMTFPKASAAMDRAEGFKPRLADKAGQMLQGLTSAGYTLIDSGGIVRWRWIEGESGLADFFKFPSASDLIDAVTVALT